MKTYLYLILIVTFTLQTVNAQKIITKKEAIQIALKNNYGILLANNQLKVAKNNASIYNARLLPTVTANGGFNFDLSNQETETQAGVTNKTTGIHTKTYNASIGANYTLFDGNGRKYNYKALKESYNLSELEVKEAIENTYIRLFNVYFQIARLSENTAILKEALQISKQRFLRATYQYEYGKATKLEVLNAKVDINNDSINLINTQQQFTNAKRDLNSILVQQKDINYTVETDVTFTSLFTFDGLYKKSLENNVVLKQQEKNIAISKFNAKASTSGLFPTIGLSTSYGWNLSDNATTAQFAQFTSNGLKAGVNLSWNIFDGGNSKTRIANSKIAVENQEIIQKQQIDNLKNVLQNTWDAYQNQLYVLKVQKQNVLTAQDNFERTNEHFKLGQVGSIQFRQAQINLLNTQTAVNNAKFDAKLIEISLLQLSGQLLDVAF